MSKPRVGFLGVGWIGYDRMQAILATGAIEAVAVCDPSLEMRKQASELAPNAAFTTTLDELLAVGVDGVAIATPSALHASHAICCLDAGAAVFCQKPLGRNAHETREVVNAALRADRLLAVDFSYRHTAAMQRIVELIRSDTLGHVFAIDLVFHNAYGPDKPWFYDKAQSGGGCLMDLGVHLVDLALWAMGFPPIVGDVTACFYRSGKPLQSGSDITEDYATANFVTGGGTSVRLACSWGLHSGQDAHIEAAFYGTHGGAVFRNFNGSFYDFVAQQHNGTTTKTIAIPPDLWTGRAAAIWAQRLADKSSQGSETEQIVAIAAALEQAYTQGGG